MERPDNATEPTWLTLFKQAHYEDSLRLMIISREASSEQIIACSALLVSQSIQQGVVIR